MSRSNLAEILSYGKKFLSGETSCLDAELLLMHVTGFTRTELYTKNSYVPSEGEEKEYKKLLSLRAEGMPVKYILGKTEFMGLPFYVNKDVLIPRPDTEILVETVLSYKKIEKILDMGCGSGCIAISLVKMGIEHAVAVDISPKALEIAEENARLNGVSEKIEFIESNLFEKIPEDIFNELDAIISNPPYIPEGEIEALQKEVRFEPAGALSGGACGLWFYREISKTAGKKLIPGKMIFFEIGYNQGKDVEAILKENGFYDIKILKDLSGLDRVIMGRK